MQSSSDDVPYQKLREQRPGRVCGALSWVRGWWSTPGADDVPLRTPTDVRARVARRLKEINLKLNFWESRMTKLKQQGQAYANKGPAGEARALAEAKIYMHLQSSHNTLVQIQTKLRLLRQEMDKMHTLQQCMSALTEGSDAMDAILRQSMSVADIDRTMARWDLQLKDASEMGRAMAQQSELSNPNLMAPSREMEEDDVALLLTQWRVEQLETLHPPSSERSPPKVQRNHTRRSEDSVSASDAPPNVPSKTASKLT